MAKTIVFIHGLFLNPKSWEEWIGYFESLGYACHAPAYPFHEGHPADLRSHPDPRLRDLTFEQVVEGMSDFIDTLPEKPILVGHSMGGLVTQKLIEKNKGIAGVCIDSAPPRGIVSFEWSFLRSNFPVINPLAGNSLYIPSVSWFQYAFCHTFTTERATTEFEKFSVPESRNIPRSTMGKEGKIDFKKPHAPLLFIAGELDHIIPPSLNRKNFEAYTDAKSEKTFKVFSGRTHFMCAQDQWTEIAEYVYHWLSRL